MCIIIVGGGVGGLASALLLQRLGMPCRVFERAQHFEDVGAGIQLSPNAMRVLRALGVANTLRQTRCEPQNVTVRHAASAKVIFSLPVGATARRRWGEDYWVVHRADLLAALHEAVNREFPATIASSAEVVGITQNTDGVAAHLANGETVNGTALIGADGLKSTVRAHIVGDGAPRFTGKVAWRALVPRSTATHGRASAPHTEEINVWASNRRHVVTYPVRGGRLLNIVGIIEEEAESAEGWSRTVEPSAFRDRFAMTPLIHPALASAVASATEVYRWPLYDRAPMTQWSEGRVTFLGDAAHPMLPSMAQGAAMALEDAWILAAELHQRCTNAPLALQDIESAFTGYEAARQTRTAAVQRRAGRNLDMFHRSGPVSAGLVYRVLQLIGHAAPALLQRQQDWIYAHDVTATHSLPDTATRPCA
ncbi:MAG: FAD-dependent monooxygenase [Pseudomonadota bacterium]